MRDLNNIRVTARGRQRKKVKGHSALPIDRRTGAKKGFAKHDGDAGGEEEGEKEAEELKKLSSVPSTVRFSMKPDRPRATFSFPLFRVSVTSARGMQPRERRPVDAVKKKGFVHGRFFYYTYTQGWERYF